MIICLLIAIFGFSIYAVSSIVTDRLLERRIKDIEERMNGFVKRLDIPTIEDNTPTKIASLDYKELAKKYGGTSGSDMVNGLTGKDLLRNMSYEPELDSTCIMSNYVSVEDNTPTKSYHTDATEIMVCECGSLEHTICFSYFDDEPEVYVYIHLISGTFWERLKYAVKYLFGYKCKYGAFDEIILGQKQYDKITQIAEHLKQNYAK